MKCLQNLVGWKDHYDTNEIPHLPNEIRVSESGEFYQEKHPAMRLDLIKACLPSNRDLAEYLQEIGKSAVTEVLNDIRTDGKMARARRQLLANDIILTHGGLTNIPNEGRFVGIAFEPRTETGVKIALNKFALQLSQAQSLLKVYLYHSHRETPIKVFDFDSTQKGHFIWKDLQWELKDEELTGGIFYVGYYQDDLIGNAIKYDKLNWQTGFCRTCDGGRNQRRYSEIQKHVRMTSFYVPRNETDPNKLMFNPLKAVNDHTNNWGFNFNISVNCDLDDFFCNNRIILKNAIALRTIYKILKDISYSQQINYIEEQLKTMIIRDLEGDKATNYINIADQYQNEIKGLDFDLSGISHICLPCTEKGITYGVV